MTGPIETFVLRVGGRAPSFTDLVGTDGRRYGLASFDDRRVLIVVFRSNGCPTVGAYEDRLNELQINNAPMGVQLVGINSNNPYLSPADTYTEMIRKAQAKSLAYPYLKDEDGSVAKAHGAICTPHAFAFDEERKLRYQGRIDDARDPTKVEYSDLAKAVEALLAGQPVTVTETPPFGCSIVW